jgi:RimJ/RimL family protein N-acetyltransferase
MWHNDAANLEPGGRGLVRGLNNRRPRAAGRVRSTNSGIGQSKRPRVSSVGGVSNRVITARLDLRPVVLDDVEDLFLITSDPATWQHAPDGVHRDREVTLDWIRRAAKRWDSDGLSYWLARRRDDGEVIGVGGAQRQRTGNWNLYYRFASHAWGRGYATELGRAALDAAHAVDNTFPVLAWVDEHNTASVRVAERLGLTNHGPQIDPSDGQTRLAYADRPVTAFH